MAISMGGIFSKPSGKVSGVVFQKARTRHGKKSAVRELVIPANPRSELQTAYRKIMSSITAGVSGIGRENYSTIWKSQVRGLAGYQSLLTIIRRQYTPMTFQGGGFSSRLVPLYRVSPIGDLHFPESVQLLPPSRTELIVEWSTENMGGSSASDRLVVIVLQNRISTGVPFISRPLRGFTGAVRGDGMAYIDETYALEWSAPDAVALMYFVQEAANGIQASPAHWLRFSRSDIVSGFADSEETNNNQPKQNQ